MVRSRVKYRQHDRKDGQLRKPVQETTGTAEAVGRVHATQVCFVLMAASG